MSELNLENLKQIKAIKRRLNEAIKERGLYPGTIVYNDLKNKLTKATEFDINYVTLQKTLSESDTTSCNMVCVIALCRLLNLDIGAVLAPPSSNESTVLYPHSNLSKNFSLLEDNHYFGVFHGYMFSSKPFDDLNKFRLEIKKDEYDKTIAILEITIPFKRGDGTYDTMLRKLVGSPILAEHQNNIHIVFTDELGSYYIFNFSYYNYRTQNLYYRRGSVMTHSRYASHAPLMESFVLFSTEVAEEYEKLIPGLLLLSNEHFHIRKETFEKLAEKEPVVQQFGESFNHLLREEIIYTISETQVLAETRSEMTNTERLTGLQLLKGNAIDPVRIFYPENEAYSEFSKDLHISKGE